MLSGHKRLRHYLDRHGLYPAQLTAPPPPDLGLVVVIPCYNEPDITTTLSSLWGCRRPWAAVEILVVVNGSSRAPAEAIEHNLATLKAVAAWGEAHNEPRFGCHGLHFPDLPPRHAGVGLARKVGLDEAIHRALQVEGPVLLLNLDADCQVDPNYLTAAEAAFSHDDPPAGACIYFEHPLEGELPPENYEAIAQYELHLRTFVQGLRVAGHPCDFHTVGSTIALPAESYARVGGMNKRRGGEDFYFLQKLAQNGHIANINDTRVLPSSRLSDRNPFGTGPALTGMVKQAQSGLHTYHPDAYLALRAFIDKLATIWHLTPGQETGAKLMVDGLGLSPLFVDFLHARGFDQRLAGIQQNTASQASFEKQFFHWFNGFMVVKWVHYFRDHGQANVPVEVAAQALLPHALQPVPPDDTCSLLQAYRDLDRRDHRERPTQ